MNSVAVVVAFVFVLVAAIVWVVSMRHSLEAAGKFRDVSDVAAAVGVLSPDGRDVVLFAGPIGDRSTRRTRLLEYRGGEVAVQRCDGSDLVRGVLVAVNVRYRMFGPLLQVSILSNTDFGHRPVTITGHALPDAATSLSKLGK